MIVVTLLLTSVSAFAGTENDAPVVGDIIFARPLGLVGIVAGAGFLSYPCPSRPLPAVSARPPKH
jgi:hypothetical protein